MDNIISDVVGKRVAIVDNDFKKIDLQKFKSLDLSKGTGLYNQYDDEWSFQTRLSYKKSKEFIDSVYEAYLSKLASWFNVTEMVTEVSLKNDGTVVMRVYAEQFANDENINIAYVESRSLEGEKGDIIRRKMLAYFKDYFNKSVVSKLT